MYAYSNTIFCTASSWVYGTIYATILVEYSNAKNTGVSLVILDNNMLQTHIYNIVTAYIHIY